MRKKDHEHNPAHAAGYAVTKKDHEQNPRPPPGMPSPRRTTSEPPGKSASDKSDPMSEPSGKPNIEQHPLDYSL